MIQFKMKDRVVLAVGSVGTGISLAHINEVLTAVASAFTVLLLGWQIVSKIVEQLKSRKTKPKTMKRIKTVYCLLFVAVLASLVGCATKNPDYNPVFPSNSGTNQPYIPDPRVQQYIDAVKNANTASAPINPYAPITGQAIEIASAAAIAISGWVARFRSQRALKDQTAVSQTLAQGVVASGSQAKALEVASSTPHYAQVANHINEATP